MDNFVLEVLVREIAPMLLGKRLEKIKQVRIADFALGLRSRTNTFFVISLEQSTPTLFLTNQSLPPQDAPSDHLLTLRKYLSGSKILALRKDFAERKLSIELETYRQSILPLRLSLVLQLIPAKANALLLDQNQEVIWSFRPTSVRSELEMETRPRQASCLPIDRVSEEEFYQLAGRSGVLDVGSKNLRKSAQGSAERACGRLSDLSRNLAGISPVFVQEVFWENRNNAESPWQRFQGLLQRVRQGPYLPVIYFLPDTKEFQTESKQFNRAPTTDLVRHSLVSPFPLDSLTGLENIQFASMNEAVAKFHQIAGSLASFRVEQRKEIARTSALLGKKRRLLKNLREDLKKRGPAEGFKKYADLLFAQNEKPPAGQTKVRLVDLFDPDQAQIEIPLDSKLSLVQNAVHYSKLYQKAKRSIPLIAARITQTEQEIACLEDEKKGLASALSIDQLFAVQHVQNARMDKEKMRKLGGVRSKEKPETSSTPEESSDNMIRRTARCFISADGLTILVGKSSRENDTLTLKIAQKDDFWLHAAGVGGSHVILKNPAKLAVPPRQSLLEAAQLAAYFSQARNAGKVEVHYTQRKFVSKPRGAKPGLVQLRSYKSVLVRPELRSQRSA